MKGSSVLSLVFTIFCFTSLGNNVYGTDPSEAAPGGDASVDGQKDILIAKFNEFLNLLIALGASDSGSATGAQSVPEYITAVQQQQQQQQQQEGQAGDEAAKQQQQQQQQEGQSGEEAAKQQQQQQQQQEEAKKEADKQQQQQQQQQQEGQKGQAEQQEQQASRKK